MNLRAFFAALCMATLLGQGLACAATSETTYRVAMVLWRGQTEAERGFLDYLAAQKLPLAVESYDLREDKSRLPALIAALKASPPDLIYTFGTTVTQAIAGAGGTVDRTRHITTTPIIFNIVADPFAAGLVDASGRSLRNLTGTSHLVPVDVQLKAIRQVGDFRKIGVVYNAAEVNSRNAVNALRDGCIQGGMELLTASVHPTADRKETARILSEALLSLRQQQVDLIYLPSDSFVISHAAEIVAAATAAGVPTFSATEEPIRHGGALWGVVSRYYNVGQFAGFKAMQILQQRVDPGQIPAETLKRFTVLVNLDTAGKLDFYPPVSVLRMAEFVKN